MRRTAAALAPMLMLTACVGEAVSVPSATPAQPSLQCASPRAGRTTFTDGAGTCMPVATLASYRCEAGRPPAIVRFAGGSAERRYLGGRFAVPVPSLPSGFTLLGRSAGTSVYSRRERPGWLWVREGHGVTRWLALPRRSPWAPARAGAATSASPHVFFIGDSITDGAAPFLAPALPRWEVGIDAVIGRSSAGGLPPARAQGALARAPGQGGIEPAPDAVVVELGTNDQDVEVFRSNVRQILTELDAVPLVLWQTVHGPTPTRGRVNHAIVDLMSATPRGAVADWHAFAADEVLGSDGIHPRPEHEGLMAELVGPLLESWREAIEGEGATSCLPV